jgi:hypothetical protein
MWEGLGSLFYLLSALLTFVNVTKVLIPTKQLKHIEETCSSIDKEYLIKITHQNKIKLEYTDSKIHTYYDFTHAYYKKLKIGHDQIELHFFNKEVNDRYGISIIAKEQSILTMKEVTQSKIRLRIT